MSDPPCAEPAAQINDLNYIIITSQKKDCKQRLKPEKKLHKTAKEWPDRAAAQSIQRGPI
jgi:hypothetical protein